MKTLRTLTLLSLLATGTLTACMIDEADEELGSASSEVLGVEPDEIDYACDPSTATPDEVAAPTRDSRTGDPEELDLACEEPDATGTDSRGTIKYGPVITIKPKG